MFFSLFNASRAGILALSVMGVTGGLVMSASAHSVQQPLGEGASMAMGDPSPQSEGYGSTPSSGRLVCKDVWVQKKQPPKDEHRIAGTAIGAVAGGLLGNQIGHGRGNTLATVGGAVAGGYVGNRVQAHQQDKNTYTVKERRCWHTH